MSENNQQPQQPQAPYYDDEISLVDLATTFIRRRKVFYVVFVLVMVVAVGFALLRGEVQETNYSTLIQLAALPAIDQQEQDREDINRGKDWQPSERVATLLETINVRWMAEAQRLSQSEGERWVSDIVAEEVEGTELIRITSGGTRLPEDEVREAHQLLAGLIINAQNEHLAQRVSLLEQQIETMNGILATHSPESLVAAQAIETRTELQQKVATGEPAAVLSLASASSRTDSGASTKLILAMAIVLGLMLGIFATFMAEFGSQVRQAMKEKD
ncbi:MAG: hypothetical protein ACQEW7_03905 [Pseudomonadota bacterium]